MGALTGAATLVSVDGADAATSADEGVAWLNVTDAPFNAVGDGVNDDSGPTRPRSTRWAAAAWSTCPRRRTAT